MWDLFGAAVACWLAIAGQLGLWKEVGRQNPYCRPIQSAFGLFGQKSVCFYALGNLQEVQTVSGLALRRQILHPPPLPDHGDDPRHPGVCL